MLLFLLHQEVQVVQVRHRAARPHRQVAQAHLAAAPVPVGVPALKEESKSSPLLRLLTS